MEALNRIEDRDGVFLSLLRAALHGEKAALPEAVEWPAVFSLAAEQNVLPMILDAAWRSAELPPHLLAYAQAVSMRVITRQTVRTQAFLKLYAALSDKGLRPAVLKGLVCRSLYPEPDQRPSGDEDILIDPEELSAVNDALLANGLVCETEEIDDAPHEITYTSPQMRIELHLSLFPTDSTAYSELNDLFEGVLARTVTVEAEGVPIRTLSPTDHLLYLLCHAYKHFLHGGVGIRQVCDLGMLSERYCSEIDWTRIRESCEKVRIGAFAGALFAIAAKHLGFAMPEAFSDLEIEEGDMLSDILSGGLYGVEDINRAHSSAITLDAVAARKQGRKSSGLWRSVFPGKGYLQSRYSYAKRHPVLIPVAWANRLTDYLGSRDRVRPGESLRIGAERVELLKKYKIIE